MSVKFSINKELKMKLEDFSEEAQRVLDSEILKSSNVFIPFDTGELMRSSLRATKFGSGKVIWDTPYARRLYYNPNYNFSKDSNPYAQGLWFEAAKSKDLNSWIEIIENIRDKML